MKNLLRWNWLWLFALASACASQSDQPATTEITASATAQLNKDGSTTVRKSTSDELSQVEASAGKYAEVDRLYPASDPPSDLALSRAVGVSVPGVIRLSDGRAIRLDGVDCSLEGVKNISHLAMFDGTSVAFIPSTHNPSNPVPAQVWLVDPPLSDTSLGPSYSPIAEVSLANGWCSPSRTPTNKYNDRYAALAKSFVGR